MFFRKGTHRGTHRGQTITRLTADIPSKPTDPDSIEMQRRLDEFYNQPYSEWIHNHRQRLTPPRRQALEGDETPFQLKALDKKYRKDYDRWQRGGNKLWEILSGRFDDEGDE